MIKNEYHHGNLKEEFLKIAFDFIAKDDVQNLTLKILSDATGTSRSAIYRHFASKDALMEMMILKGFEEFDGAISPILRDPNKPLVDRFYLSGKAYIEFAMQNPNLYRLLFGKKYANIRENIINIQDENCSGFSALKAAIEEGQKSGILKKEASFERTILIWSSLHGFASLLIDGFMDINSIHTQLYDKMFQDMLAASTTKTIKMLSSIPFINDLFNPTK